MKKYFIIICCLIQTTLFSQTPNCRVVFIIGDQKKADYIVNYKGQHYELHTENYRKYRGYVLKALNIYIPDTTELCSELPFGIIKKGRFNKLIDCKMDIRYYGNFSYLVITHDHTRKAKYRFSSFWLNEPFYGGIHEKVWSYEDKELLLKECEALW